MKWKLKRIIIKYKKIMRVYAVYMQYCFYYEWCKAIIITGFQAFTMMIQDAYNQV